jgi:hypothetical protein
MIKSMYIKKVEYLGDFKIKFITTEEKVRKIDLKPLLKGNMGDFKCLRDEEVFKKFYLDTFILTWDVELPKGNKKQISQFDIAPEYIGENSVPVRSNQRQIKSKHLVTQ